MREVCEFLEEETSLLTIQNRIPNSVALPAVATAASEFNCGLTKGNFATYLDLHRAANPDARYLYPTAHRLFEFTRR